MKSHLIRHGVFRTTAIASALMLATSMALAAKPTDPGGGGKPPTGESGVNNVSFPLILSDNVGPPALPSDGIWRFATITNPVSQCIGEAGVTPGTTVDPSIPCYFGRKVVVIPETGSITFEGDPKVWWLQKRPLNFWKTLTVGHDITTPLVVSAVDIGDLLESTPTIATRQIRVEFNLLQSVPSAGHELSQYVGLDKCKVPAGPDLSIGCFAAFGMSGAVPGTEQSGNEIQGTDFLGVQTLLDPVTVRSAKALDETYLPVQAIVYSRCARLVIQRITGNPGWNPALGQWDGASEPVVNVAAYRNEFGTEITSGGSFVYGYNWNAKTAATGTYRLTFVLDGNDAEGPMCTTALGTKFESGGTQMVNVGENNKTATIVYAGDSPLGDEGGLAYMDVTLTAKGGGKKGGN